MTPTAKLHPQLECLAGLRKKKEKRIGKKNYFEEKIAENKNNPKDI